MTGAATKKTFRTAIVPAAGLGKLHVERKAVGDQVVNANIGFVVFVRSEQRP